MRLKSNATSSGKNLANKKLKNVYILQRKISIKLLKGVVHQNLLVGKKRMKECSMPFKNATRLKTQSRSINAMKRSKEGMSRICKSAVRRKRRADMKSMLRNARYSKKTQKRA
jgi:hypothetical protein